jgi:dimethylargininase
VTIASSTFEAPYVRADFAPLSGVVVAPPTRTIETVAPTHGEAHAIAARAADQFEILVGRLGAAGVKVVRVEPNPATPLSWACADCAVLFADGAFLMRPSDVRRRAEVAMLEEVLERANIPVVGRIEAPGLLDGGDVLLASKTLYVARSKPRQAEIGIPAGLHGNALGRAQLADYARSKQLAVVEVAIAGEVPRLRSVASLVDEGTLLFAPGLVDAGAFSDLQTIEVPRGEDFGAGVLALGNRRVIANLRFRQTIPLLRKAKFAVDAIDLWEFGKIGVTPASLALAIKRG